MNHQVPHFRKANAINICSICISRFTTVHTAGPFSTGIPVWPVFKLSSVPPCQSDHFSLSWSHDCHDCHDLRKAAVSYEPIPTIMKITIIHPHCYSNQKKTPFFQDVNQGTRHLTRFPVQRFALTEICFSLRPSAFGQWTITSIQM